MGIKVKRPHVRQGQAGGLRLFSACRRSLKKAVPGVSRWTGRQTGDPVTPSSTEGENGSLMLDILIGLFIASLGLCLVLGSIALTSWRAGYAKEDTYKIIQTRNERAKAGILEINPDTFKDE